MKQVLILVAVLAIAAVLSVTVPVIDGKPLVNFDKLRADVSRQVTPMLEQVQDQVQDHADMAPQEPPMYRWRDDGGRWQYGSVPPAGVVAEPVTLQRTQVVPSEEFKQGKY